MLFSQTAEYAVRAVVYLASVHDRPRTSAQIAAATRVPANYLSKLMMTLRKGGLVDARRGVGGGFGLARPPAEITVLDIVDAVDPVQRIRSCPLNLEVHGTHLCPMHRKLDEAMALIQKTLGETLVTDLLKKRSRSRPMDLPLPGPGAP